MPEPMNYQQALKIDAVAYYYRRKNSTYSWDVCTVNDVMKGNLGDSDAYEFLPIPTPEELLSEVECEVLSEFSSKPGVTFGGQFEFQEGDTVIVRKVKG